MLLQNRFHHTQQYIDQGFQRKFEEFRFQLYSNTTILFGAPIQYILLFYSPHCSKLKLNGKTTKPVPIPLPRASRNFPDVKTRYNWTSEIIPFIRLGKQMDRTQIFFEMSKVAFFIVIQLCYNELWSFSQQKWSKVA